MFRYLLIAIIIRQPLREAVSWNPPISELVLLLLLSASSWGCELKFSIVGIDSVVKGRQPLREAVSWNAVCVIAYIQVTGQPLREAVSWNTSEQLFFQPSNHVSLFVRLWVEIFLGYKSPYRLESASSWGCELKYTNIFLENFEGIVSLFVRLWVEIPSIRRLPSGIVVSLFVRLWVEIEITLGK